MTQSTETPILRTLGPGDLDELCRLEALCFTDPWSRDSLAEELDNPLAVYTGLGRGSALLGYVGTRRVLDEWEIVNVAVDPAFRREHLGSRLLEAVLGEARAQGAKQVFLEVRESNAPARGLYEKYGFRPIARRKHYYDHPVENAIVMAWGGEEQ